MTYGVALRLDRGLVFMTDTRTNAGVDNIATFRKMFTWCEPGESVVTLLTAGNLATTQSVISLIDERTKAPDDRSPSILGLPSMFRVAQTVGDTLREVIETQAASKGQDASGPTFKATLIVGGQVKGSAPRLFLVYPEGNFIEASDDTPFFQIGETKYGRPILVRAYDRGMSFEEAVRLLLVSFDSTIKANLSVGMPIDLSLYETGSLRPGLTRRIAEDDPAFRAVSDGWGDALRSSLASLPPIEL